MGQKLLDFIKKLLPDLLVILIFLVVTVAYFSPAFEGKVLKQMDVDQAKALSHRTKELYEKTGHYSPWNDALFSGMPNYQIYTPHKPSIFALKRYLFHILPYHSASIFFFYLLGFYLLLLVFRVDRALSATIAIAFGLSSYNIIIIAVGHITKAYAIALMPLVIASFLLIYENKNYLWGGIALVFALGMQISTTHVQIVYYTALMMGAYVIYRFIIDWFKNKDHKHFILASVTAVLATILALLPNTENLWMAYEIGKYSIRGGPSEIKTEGKSKAKVKGLDKDYALAWSYGVGESLSLLIPDIKGGASDYIGNDPKLVAKINASTSINPNFKQYLVQQSRYWGPQPFTAGPVYFGAIIMFLFVLGMFIVKDNIKWWLFAVTVLSIMLAWGKHFMPLTDIFFYYFPLYNKFRVVSMILVIASAAVPILAALAIKEIITDPQIIKTKLKYFIISFALTGGIALIIALIPSIVGPFLSPQEQQFLNNLMSSQSQNPQLIQQYKEFFSDLEHVRAMIVKADAWRSFIFISLAALLILAYSYAKNFPKLAFYSALGLLIIVDLWAVDRRYLNYNNFIPKRVSRNTFKPTPADKFILKTNALDYRVLNLTRDPFNDALTSYFHQSIGGYSAAKLRRYQDLIEYYLAPYSQMIIKALKDTTGTTSLSEILKPMQALHMLNTLYIIVNPNTVPIINQYAYGNAWFVNGYRFVTTAKDEIQSLERYDLTKVAVINKKKFGNIDYPELKMLPDSARYIKLVKYLPDQLEYESFSHNTEFAVFSEIYYPEGWQATIDGKPAKIINVDYVLRGMIIPPGKHKIVMTFKPKPYYLGEKISLYSSIFVVLIILGGIIYSVYKNKNNAQEQ